MSLSFVAVAVVNQLKYYPIRIYLASQPGLTVPDFMLINTLIKPTPTKIYIKIAELNERPNQSTPESHDSDLQYK